MNQSIYFGIVGDNGSGKSTACDILKSEGFTVSSLSSVVRNYVTSLGLKQERDTLIKYANKLKEEHGLDYFAKTCFHDVQKDRLDFVVFDSVRHPAEVDFLKSNHVYFIGLKVPLEVRYKRIKDRMAETDFVDFETFKKQDELEKSGTSSGQFIDEAFNLCDEIIINSDNLDQLKKQLLSIVETLKEKKHA